MLRSTLLSPRQYIQARLAQMFQPISPADFCEEWVPKRTGLHPGEYGYRRACINLLNELTRFATPTCDGWLSGKKPPEIVPLYLRAVHILWGIQERLSTGK